MRTPADCIHALKGCIRVGNPERWTLAVDEEIASDVIAHLEGIGADLPRCGTCGMQATPATLQRHHPGCEVGTSKPAPYSEDDI